MKSIKKKFKEKLAAINLAARDLATISEGLSHLSVTRQIAETALNATMALTRRASALKKTEFREGIADAEALAILEEISDSDITSALEEKIFTDLGGPKVNGDDLLFQQLMDKVEKRHAELQTHIQELIGLLEG